MEENFEKGSHKKDSQVMIRKKMRSDVWVLSIKTSFSQSKIVLPLNLSSILQEALKCSKEKTFSFKIVS